ncbi:MAG: cytochrome c3 family protein [Micromonosporaceae bacterium]
MVITRGGRTATGLLASIFLVMGAVPLAAQGAAPAPGTAGYKAPVITDTATLAGPRQPIFFRHDIHAGQDRIPCLYCHNTVTVSSEPGMPALRTCIGCHQIIGGSTPSHQAEIAKVRKAWSDRKPPEWIRVYWVPGFVHFPHMRHIKVLGNTPDACANCHGAVNGTTQISQVKTLKMGWCIQCHMERKLSRDCSVCHY